MSASKAKSSSACSYGSLRLSRSRWWTHRAWSGSSCGRRLVLLSSKGDGSLMELGVHKLQIGNTLIKANTNVSPRSMVPGVKILALKVNLGVFKEIQMLANFLRCFPNFETLHVESARADEPTGYDYLEFFKEFSPIECVQSHIKMVVTFIKYMTQRANELKKMRLCVF
ncbi:hypothetical protein HU200_052203 [Digitaria exilis]|uniref:F-box/LRR-repeat protein 15/At3g58940/PEG3-like LRR domain-containing protein n=1 Tax=Digitaria exilis TaxID=1010633 RepID=A0A835E4E6_9POAL|nr:hypothetical protein HU200_052203 [Digitaria exilis]